MKNPFRLRTTIACLTFVGATAWVLRPSPAWGQTAYTASWASVDTHPAAPEWFQDAKFGIYFHWGAFSVAQFGSEWYPRNLYNKSGSSSEYQHHLSTYGDPFSAWPYDKFLTGANDKTGKLTQFAPKLKADGGNFDPDAWAQIFLDAGARFAGPVAEHHDGFSMWDSKVNEWNSVALGPKLNLAKLHADAIRKRGLKLIMSQHTAYNFTGFYQWAPAQSDASLKKLYGQLAKADEETLWLDKLKEIIDEFLPDVIWQDFNLNQISEANRLQFLAYYYNAAAKAGKDVVATYKDGFNNKGEVYDYERGGPADITTPYWLTDDAVSPSSWSYTSGMGYYSAAQEVGSFIDRVSKGGNLLLNISPTWDGTIPAQQQAILTAFGTFLKQMGTAIYNTRAWVAYGEGPTKLGGGSFTAPTALTANDVRYTKSKDGDALYAILGGWPGNGKTVNLTAVTSSRFPLGSGKVFLFGPTGGAAIELAATQDTSGLHVTLPGTQPYTAIAYALKISKSGTVPAPTPWLGNDNPDGGAGGTGGTGGSDAGTAGAGGSTGTGGRAGDGGPGGATGAGGARDTGGSPGSGGARSSGGATASGGAANAGGASGRGGTTGTASSGGATGAGGSSAGGGVSGSGKGGSGGTGGLGVASGGTAADGGSSGKGGSSTSGATGRGGSGAGGETGTPTGPGKSSGCSCTIQGKRSTNAAALLLVLGLLHAVHLLRLFRVSNRSSRCGSWKTGRPDCGARS